MVNALLWDKIEIDTAIFVDMLWVHGIESLKVGSSSSRLGLIQDLAAISKGWGDGECALLLTLFKLEILLLSVILKVFLQVVLDQSHVLWHIFIDNGSSDNVRVELDAIFF